MAIRQLGYKNIVILKEKKLSVSLYVLYKIEKISLKLVFEFSGCGDGVCVISTPVRWIKASYMYCPYAYATLQLKEIGFQALQKDKYCQSNFTDDTEEFFNSKFFGSTFSEKELN